MSAKHVKIGLEEVGHKVKLFDLKKGYPALKKICKDFDVIFPSLHGKEGEGGNLQKFLSKLDKPFVGGDWKGYKKGWHKISFKKFCDENNIPTAKWKIIKDKKDILKFGLPSVLKSNSGGSSREVAIIKDRKDLNKNNTERILNLADKLLVEEFLPGVEITVAVLKDEQSSILRYRALPVLEIVPPKGGWFDYKNKYWGNVKEIPHAPSLDEKTKKLAQNFSLKIHKYFKLGQFSRTDFIVSNNKIYILEVNTIPGLTSSSLFPKAALAAGIQFPDLLDKIIKLAIRNFKNTEV